MPLAPRTRLGPYEIISLFGTGGMGEVYRAQDLRLERQVALKVLRPEFVGEDDRLRRFEQEARAVSALNHPNIVTIFDIGQAEGVAFYVMELVLGRALRELLTRHPLPLDTTLDIAAQIADGLAQAHDAGIIHRDLKPENVLISDEGFVKIVDFGIAKLLPALERSTAITSPQGVPTLLGIILGTAGYMSPEQVVGAEIGVRSDVFALGTILYEMLAGRGPFERTTPVQTMSAIIEFDPVPLSACVPGVPIALSGLVQRLLHKDPRERPDAKPLARELRGMRAALPATLRAAAPATSQRGTSAGTDRRHVTIIEAELSDYGSLVDSLGSDEAVALHARIECAFDACVAAHGGIAQNRGERFVALFGLHSTAEDDAVQATRAACEFRDEARSLADAMRAARAHALPRLGIASGDVIVLGLDSASGRYRVTGETGQIVSKMLDAADGDEILVTSETWRLVDGFVDGEAGPRVRLKGHSDDTRTFRVTRQAAAQTRLEAEERRGLTTFAGRQEELGLLRVALSDTLAGGGRVVKVVGEPGMGKSRLLHEFRAGLETSVHALRGRCLAHNRRSRYLPFFDPLRDLLLTEAGEHSDVDTVLRRLRDIDPELVAYAALYLDVLSLRSVEHQIPADLKGDDLSLAFRDALAGLLTAASGERPLVLLLEDWHWADRASDELLYALSGLTGAHPLLVVVTTRPEAPASNIAWQTVITLSGVDVATTGVLAGAVLGGSRVARGFAAFVHERSAGNPLFVEELCRTLRDDGHLRVKEAVVELGTAIGSAHLPDTIHAVLRSRLSRLEPSVRDLLRTASVVGREFSRAILTRVSDEPATLAPDLETLKASRMIHQIRLVPDAGFRFHHALLHDVAYQSLLTYQRRVKHGQVAEAILAHWPNHVDDHSEELARHFAAAEDWPRAARHGLAAAKRAVHQNRFADARDILDDVLAASARVVGDEVADVRLAALLEQERVCETFGDRVRQRSLVDELLSLARQHPDAQHLAQALLRQGDLNALEGHHDVALVALDEALDIRRAMGDEEGTRNVLRSISFTCWQSGDFEHALVCAEESLAFSIRLQDPRGEATDRSSVATLLRRQGRREQALAQIERAVEIVDAQPDPRWLGHVFYTAGALYRAVGLFQDSKRAYQRAFELAGRRASPFHQAPALMALAALAVDEGEIDESLRLYEQAAEIYRGLQHAQGIAQVLKQTADVMIAIGRHEGALSRALESAALFGRLEDRENEAAAWRLAATTAEAIPGRDAQAEDAWRRLAGLLRAGACHSGLAESLLGLARVLRARHASDDEVLALYDEALADAHDAGSKDLEAKVWNARGILHWSAGRFEAAMHCYEQGLVLARETGDGVHTAFLLNSLAATLKSLGRPDNARMRFEEALGVSRDAGAGQVEAHALAGLGDLALDTANPEQAAIYYRESLSLREVLADRRGEGWMRARLAGALSVLGRTVEAQALRAEARAIADIEGDDRLRTAAGG